MSKKINTLLGAAALIAGSSFITAAVVGGGPEKGDHANHGGPDMDAMMGLWMDYMTPGDEHKELARFVGHWEMKTKMRTDPNTPAQESMNKVVVKPVLGGRFFVEHVYGEPDGMMPGRTFEGMNLMGYDKHRKQYTFAWADNMSTGIFTGLGSANADGSVITYMGEAPDLLNPGAMKPVKSVARIIDHDNHEFEMWEINESGDWWKSFEGTYTRIKDGNDMNDMKKMKDMKNMKGHDHGKSMR
ncbi:DUF1579 domain-containing protein [Planctomycetaceae bacterium AH-315-I19]|nr:DUF1579 domain-containing protein [Planctomycetaceae bacterium AH-315-I19]